MKEKLSLKSITTFSSKGRGWFSLSFFVVKEQSLIKRVRAKQEVYSHFCVFCFYICNDFFFLYIHKHTHKYTKNTLLSRKSVILKDFLSQEVHTSLCHLINHEKRWKFFSTQFHFFPTFASPFTFLSRRPHQFVSLQRGKTFLLMKIKRRFWLMLEWKVLIEFDCNESETKGLKINFSILCADSRTTSWLYILSLCKLRVLEHKEKRLKINSFSCLWSFFFFFLLLSSATLSLGFTLFIFTICWVREREKYEEIFYPGK